MMDCPICKTNNDADVPVRVCRCGYNAFAMSQVGDNVHRILSWFRVVPCCSCNAWRIKMNRWGIDGCKEHSAEIYSRFTEQASKKSVPKIVSIPGSYALLKSALWLTRISNYKKTRDIKASWN